MWDWLKDWVRDLFASLIGWFSDKFSSLNELKNWVLQKVRLWIIDNLADIAEWLKPKLEAISDWGKQIVYKTYKYITNVTEQITSWLGERWEDLASYTVWLTVELNAWFIGKIDSIQGLIDNAIDNLLSIEPFKSLRDAWNMNIFGEIKDAFVGLYKMIRDFAEEEVDYFKDVKEMLEDIGWLKK